MGKVVSHYQERSKKFFGKFHFGGFILAQSVRFFAATRVSSKRGKKVKKLKKETQKSFKKGGKGKKRRKIEKKDAKRCTSFRSCAAEAFQMIIDELQLTIGEQMNVEGE